MGNSSLIFWEALTFVVLMTVFFLFIYPKIRRWKKQFRETTEGSEQQRMSSKETLDRRYAESEISREGYLQIKDDMTKTTEDQNAR